MDHLTAEQAALQFAIRADGVRLAYRFQSGNGPVIVFLPGYKSDMQGGKAVAVAEWAATQGRAMLRLDYSGCGESEGVFEAGTLPTWCDDVLAVINAVTTAPVILVGSSLGGWLMLLIAHALGAERVAALVGIAAAPDFTDWGFTADEKAAIERDGKIERPSDYGYDPMVTTRAFWQSGEANRQLESDIAITCPVRLLHGQNDPDVPWQISLRLAERLRSSDVQTMLIKDGDHRLSRDQDIILLIETIAKLPL